MSHFKTEFLDAYKKNFQKKNIEQDNYAFGYQHPSTQHIFFNQQSPRQKNTNILEFQMKPSPNGKQSSQTINTQASRFKLSRHQHNRSIEKNHRTQPSQEISRAISPNKNLANSDIEDHLVRQNQNLRQHRNFLLKEIRKANKKLKDLKEQNEYLRQQYEKIQNQRVQEQQQNYQLKMLIMQCANRITGNQQIKHIMKSYIERSQRGQSQLFNSDLLENLQHIPLTQNNPIKSHNLKNASKTSMQNISKNPQQTQNFLNELENTNNIQIKNQINSLNDQFEAMMYEYKTTKNLQSRKKCIEIAWKLKELKKEEKDHQSQEYANLTNQRKAFTVNSTHIHKPFEDIHRTVKSSNNNSYNYISSPKFKKKNSNPPPQGLCFIHQSQ